MSTISPAKDFFISYNKADRDWAVWIAWELEEAGFGVIIQEWDFRGNFVLEMDRGHREAARTIAVLSPDYVASLFVQAEWTARLAEDPAGKSDRLIPIRVRDVELEGLLAQIIYTDLVGLGESQARSISASEPAARDSSLRRDRISPDVELLVKSQLSQRRRSYR